MTQPPPSPDKDFIRFCRKNLQKLDHCTHRTNLRRSSHCPWLKTGIHGPSMHCAPVPCMTKTRWSGGPLRSGWAGSRSRRSLRKFRDPLGQPPEASRRSPETRLPPPRGKLLPQTEVSEEFVSNPDAIQGIPREQIERQVEDDPEHAGDRVPLPKYFPPHGHSRGEADGKKRQDPRPPNMKGIPEMFFRGADSRLHDSSHSSFSSERHDTTALKPYR